MGHGYGALQPGQHSSYTPNPYMDPWVHNPFHTPGYYSDYPDFRTGSHFSGSAYPLPPIGMLPYQGHESHAAPPPRRPRDIPTVRALRPRYQYIEESDSITENSSSDSESWESAQETLSDEDEAEGPNARSGNRTGAHNVEDSAGRDPFGRPWRHSDKSGTQFMKIIPDNPFGIIRGPFSRDQQHQDHSRAMPILQFFTWHTWLYVRQAQVTGPSVDDATSLAHYDIIDKAGDWCGSIMLPINRNNTRLQDVPQPFIAISDAKAFTREECPIWNYYIPKEREESEWDLYYVLLLQHDPERGLWERVALGKVFKTAFSPLVANWEEIKLG